MQLNQQIEKTLLTRGFSRKSGPIYQKSIDDKFGFWIYANYERDAISAALGFIRLDVNRLAFSKIESFSTSYLPQYPFDVGPPILISESSTYRTSEVDKLDRAIESLLLSRIQKLDLEDVIKYAVGSGQYLESNAIVIPAGLVMIGERQMAKEYAKKCVDRLSGSETRNFYTSYYMSLDIDY